MQVRGRALECGYISVVVVSGQVVMVVVVVVVVVVVMVTVSRTIIIRARNSGDCTCQVSLIAQVCSRAAAHVKTWMRL
jgi:hypothetical protein